MAITAIETVSSAEMRTPKPRPVNCSRLGHGVRALDRRLSPTTSPSLGTALTHNTTAGPGDRPKVITGENALRELSALAQRHTDYLGHMQRPPARQLADLLAAAESIRDDQCVRIRRTNGREERPFADLH